MKGVIKIIVVEKCWGIDRISFSWYNTSAMQSINRQILFKTYWAKISVSEREQNERKSINSNK